MRTSRKLIITSLALLAGASLVGSITGTVAWFQYATRAQVAYTGLTAHCTKMLEISVDNGNTWKTEIGKDELAPLMNFAPVTTGSQAMDEAISVKEKTSSTEFEDDGITPKVYRSQFYKQPTPRQGLYSNWLLADPANFAQFDILVRSRDIDEKANSEKPNLLVNDVYLTDLVIQDASSNGSLDLSNAIRVHFATSYIDAGTEKHEYALFSKETNSIDVGGFLDVDNNGELDYNGYDFNGEHCVYGGGTNSVVRDPESDAVISETLSDLPTQTSYSIKDERDPGSESSPNPNYHGIFAKEADGNIIDGKSFGKTSATVESGTQTYLKITVTIWLEGWSVLQHGAVPASSQSSSSESGEPQATQSNIWDSEAYTKKSFNVGMTFGVKLHSDDHQ